jgi:hypothetical protein
VDNIKEEKKTPQDRIVDISMAQVRLYNLSILPYFFDRERAKRLGIDYVYVGIMN